MRAGRSEEGVPKGVPKGVCLPVRHVWLGLGAIKCVKILASFAGPLLLSGRQRVGNFLNASAANEQGVGGDASRGAALLLWSGAGSGENDWNSEGDGEREAHHARGVVFGIIEINCEFQSSFLELHI